MKLAAKIGKDEVWADSDSLLIYAAEPMDIPIREFSRVPVYFRMQKYFVSSKRKAAGRHAIVYELCPWPPDAHDFSSREVVYDEDYVRERGETAASRRHRETLH